MSTTPHDAATTVDGDATSAGLAPALRTLRALPPVAPGAVDRVMAAAVARGHRPGHAGGRSASRVAGGAWPWRAAAGLALAAGLGSAAVWAGRGPLAVPTSAVAAASPAANAGATAVGRESDGDFLPASATGGEADAPLPVPFLLRRPAAGQVTVVGDFNGWNPKATPLIRSADGTWTATVRLSPGRHAYAYVVDDSAWVTDPQAPVARDDDYGRDHSIVVVGAP